MELRALHQPGFQGSLQGGHWRSDAGHDGQFNLMSNTRAYFEERHDYLGGLLYYLSQAGNDPGCIKSIDRSGLSDEVVIWSLHHFAGGPPPPLPS